MRAGSRVVLAMLRGQAPHQTVRIGSASTAERQPGLRIRRPVERAFGRPSASTFRQHGAMRRADLWNAMPIVIALVGAAGALTLAWLSRVFVGLEAGKSCELAPAWRAHLSWWLFILSALLLLGLECDGIRQLRRDRRTRSTFPSLASSRCSRLRSLSTCSPSDLTEPYAAGQRTSNAASRTSSGHGARGILQRRHVSRNATVKGSR